MTTALTIAIWYLIITCCLLILYAISCDIKRWYWRRKSNKLNQNLIVKRMEKWEENHSKTIEKEQP